MLGLGLLFLWGTMSVNAQTALERAQFLKDYKDAIASKTAIINANPEMKQQAQASGWFQMMSQGLQNAQNFANGNPGSIMMPTVNSICENATPFCSSSATTYPAGVNAGTGQSGPCYSCLGSEPNPAWLYLKIGTSGDIHITETNSNNIDVDFCLWGPFPSQNSCTALTCAKVVDCSYSSSPIEYIDIPTAVTGEYYILIITNFSNNPTNITLAQTSGSGSTDCSIVNPPPPAPVGGGASSVTSTSFTANWASASTATGYYLDIALDAGFTNFLTGYNNLNVNNVTSVNVTGLLPGTTYFYRVRAYNANGTSPNSNVIIVTTLPTITGSGNGCLNMISSYSTQAGRSAYTWTVIGGNITAGSGTNTIQVNWINTGNQSVSVNYTSTAGFIPPSPATMTVTVIPLPNQAGTLTGPQQVCQGVSGYVYTTPTIPNATGYNWTIPVGASITAGANTNTVTISYNATALSGHIVVWGVNSCGGGAPSQLLITINAAAVPTITGATSVCAGTTGKVYTTEPGMTNYTWTLSAGGTITAGSGTNSITVTWGGVGSQTVTLNYSNASGCQAITPTVLPVTVNPLPVPTISGAIVTCQGTTSAYTTQTGQSNYTWTLSSGGQIMSGQGTSTANIKWNGAGAQTVYVNYSNAFGCMAVAPTSYAVTVNAAPVPTITGPTAICATSGYHIYTTETGMTGYNWIVSSGGSIFSGQGTNSIWVYWATAGNQSVTITYFNANSCAPVTPVTLPVLVTTVPPASAGPVSGPSTVCAGQQGVAYSIAPVSGAVAYDWAVPSGAIIVSGMYTNSITINFAVNAQNGPITAWANNICGNSNISPPLNITVNALPAAAGSITGSAQVCANATNIPYTVGAIANTTGYNWAIPTGASITSGANTNSIIVSFGVSSGNVTVAGTNGCGAGQVSPNFSVNVQAKPLTPTITANGYVLSSSATTGNQWYHDGTAVSGATGQTYTVPASAPGFVPGYVAKEFSTPLIMFCPAMVISQYHLPEETPPKVVCFFAHPNGA